MEIEDLKRGSTLLSAAAGLLLVGITAASLHAQVSGGNYAVRGRVVTVGPAGTLEDGLVLIRDGKIEALGTGLTVPEDYVLLGGEGKFVTPGLIDSHSRLGISGTRKSPYDELNEESSPVNPGLRIVDAVRWDSPGFERVLQYGITTVYVAPGNGNVIGGQGALLKTTAGRYREKSIVKSYAALECALGALPVREWRPRQKRPTSRMSAVALLRETLLAGSWRGSPPEDFAFQDPVKAALGDVLSGEVPSIICAEWAHDIEAALRVAREFGLRLVIACGGESFKLSEVLAKTGTPVLLGPLMRGYSPGGVEPETSLDAPARLQSAGVKFALMSNATTEARGLTLVAALAMANGLAEDAAYRALTLSPAEIFGVEQRVGSLETGKDADLVVFSGSPFDLKSKVEAVLVDGRLEYSRPRVADRAGSTATVRENLLHQQVRTRFQPRSETGDNSQ